ncbi:MAG: PEP-CTERM sorting domain-containing protein [Phycisphaeraceae bacterium]|nr:PEP-CTERM sorting domain-containing protein [Phycisphaeraceae bacterium]
MLRCYNRTVRGLACSLFAVASLGVVSSGHAALLLEENFDPDILGIDSGNMAGSPHWSGGTNRLQYDSINLAFDHASYAELSNANDTGSARSLGGNADTRGASRFVSDTVLTGDLWFSALHQLTGNPRANEELTVISFSSVTGFTPGSNTLFGIGNDEGTLKPAARNGGMTTFGEKTLALNTTYLIVANVVIDSDGPDTLNVWYFDEDDSFSAGTLGTAHLTLMDADFSDFTRVWIGRAVYTSGNGTAGSLFDALRVGTSAEQVLIPEPTSAALLGMAAGIMLLRRRS